MYITYWCYCCRMAVKALLSLCMDAVLKMTLNNSNQIMNNKQWWSVIYDSWSYIVLLPSYKTELIYKMLNQYCHFLSHECKSSVNETFEFPTLNADEVFNLLVTCQCPKVIFDYQLKRQRVNSSQTIPVTKYTQLKKYFCNRLRELDLSGADFCFDESLLTQLLPKCHSLTVLSLGNSGSNAVLQAARNCPLEKLQIEERIPLHPKLPQAVVLKYVLGYTGSVRTLQSVLELCRCSVRDEPVTAEDLEEEEEFTLPVFFNKFLDECKPTWPNLKVLMFGNLRLSREALILCVFALKNLEEVTMIRTQSDEILSTCESIMTSFGTRRQISIKKLVLWAGWEGLWRNTLKIAPHTEDLSLVVYGHPYLNLPEVLETNETLANVTTLGLVGLRSDVQNIFYRFCPIINKIKNLRLCGYILTSEEIVAIITYLPDLLTLQVDYSELRNYDYFITEERYPTNAPLSSLTIEASYIEEQVMFCIYLMAPNISNLSIKGKTKTFNLSLRLQKIFLQNNGSLQNLELYPKYPLNIPCLLTVARSKKISRNRLKLKVPLSSLTKEEFETLSNSGWNILPLCFIC